MQNTQPTPSQQVLLDALLASPGSYVETALVGLKYTYPVFVTMVWGKCSGERVARPVLRRMVAGGFLELFYIDPKRIGWRIPHNPGNDNTLPTPWE